MGRYRQSMSEALNIVAENTATAAQVQNLKRAYADMKGKKISLENAKKLQQIFNRFDSNKELLKQLYKADIPFVSAMASARLISKHAQTAQMLMQIRKEGIETAVTELKQINDGPWPLDEGRMKDIYQMQKDGATAKQIAKKMKLDIKVVKSILGEETELTESATQMNNILQEQEDEKGASTAKVPAIDKDNKPGVKIAKIRLKRDKMDGNGTKTEDPEKVKDKLDAEIDKNAVLKQKMETEKQKSVEKATKKLINPETGEPLLQVGIAYKHLKDKMKKAAEKKEEEKPEVKEETLVEYTDKQIKMAFGILNDPRYKGGNYSGAFKAIEKIAKGLASHPSVANALKRANESLEITEGLKIANLVGQSIAHLDMYVELAEDVKKEYFKSGSQMSMFTKSKADQVLKSVPKLIKELRKPGIFTEENIAEGTMVGGLIKYGGQPSSEYNKAVADYKKFMSKSQHSKGAGEKVLGFLFDDSLLDDLYAAQKKNLGDVRPMVVKRMKELGLKEDYDTDIHFGISGVETERPTDLTESTDINFNPPVDMNTLKKYGTFSGQTAGGTDRFFTLKGNNQRMFVIKKAGKIGTLKITAGNRGQDSDKQVKAMAKDLRYKIIDDGDADYNMKKEELEEAKAPFRLSYSDKYGKHAGFEDGSSLQDIQNKAQKLRAKGFKIDKMGRNTSPVKEDFTKKDYDKNEKDNEHSLNTLELVKKFGNSSEKTKMKGIYDRHMKRGHITDPDYSERNKLNQKYYKKLKENFTVQITKTDDSKLVHGSYKTKAEAEKFIRWYKTGNLSKMKAIKIIPESVDPEAVQEGYQGTILAYLKKYTDKAYFKYHKLLVKKGTEGMVKTALTRGVDDRASLIYQYDLPQIVAEDKEGSAYAIGMAKAKKMYNDEPPLEKKTIRKAHHIADKILNNQVQNGDGMETPPETDKPKKKIKIGIVHPAKETLDRLWHKRGDKK